MPAHTRASVRQMIADDPEARSRGAIFTAQRSVSPPKGEAGAFSRAQQQNARGLGWKVLAWEWGYGSPRRSSRRASGSRNRP
jgi:hypothetical protein